MKDMYIDYNNYGGDRDRKKRVLAVVILVILAIAVGFGGYFAITYYLRTMEEQREDSVIPEPSAAEYVNDQTGVYGLWYEEETKDDTPEQSDYDMEEAGWMSGFVDDRRRVDAKALYVSSAHINDRLDELLRIADETEINALVIDIKDESGKVICDLGSPMAEELGAVSILIDDLPVFMRKLKDHNIYAIARIVAFKDPVAAKKNRDMAFRNTDGTLYYDSSSKPWLNPYKQEAWDYIRELGALCALSGFDEINYDYVCFCSENSLNKADFSAAPEGVTRMDVITEGIRDLCEYLKPMGVYVSCNVYGTVINSSVDSRVLGQNYFRLAQYVDYICPLLYPSHYGRGYYSLDIPDNHPYDLVFGMLRNSIKALYTIDMQGNKADVRPMLQDFTATWVTGHLTYGTYEVRAQIDATYDAGYYQWMLWNTNGIYTEDALMPAN